MKIIARNVHFCLLYFSAITALTLSLIARTSFRSALTQSLIAHTIDILIALSDITRSTL